MTAKHVAAALSLILCSALHPGFSIAETGAQFPDIKFPLVLPLPGGTPEGQAFFETPYSQAPTESYDTVLIQGEMPDPAVSIEILQKSRSIFSQATRNKQEAFHRFPSGRFWARYTLPPSRRPIKLSILNHGIKNDSTLTIYEVQLVVGEPLKEEPKIPSAIYIPDPQLFLSQDAPIRVIRRQEWNAAPSKEPYTPHTPRYFTIHHTQAHYPKTKQEAIEEMQFIQDFHQNGRRWIDIGYHFLIDPLGNIYEGRPLNALGAHVKGRNTSNIGISIMGNYHPPTQDEFTPETSAAFVAMGRYLKDTYEVPVSSFFAHRDIGSSECPGDNLYALKPVLSSLIFAPAPVDSSAEIPSPAELSPAQNSSLRQLMDYLHQP